MTRWRTWFVMGLGGLGLAFGSPAPGMARGGAPSPPTSFCGLDRRPEILADRLAEDLSLDRRQRREMQALLDQARAVTEPIRGEIRRTQLALREAVKAGADLSDLGPLHGRLGKAHARLVAVQSVAFAAGLQLLDQEQKPDAEVLFDVLVLIVAPSPPPLTAPSAPSASTECPTNRPAPALARPRPGMGD